MLESTHLSYLATPGLSKNETTEPKKLESSRDLPTTVVMIATSPKVILDMGSSVAMTVAADKGGQLSPDRFASTLTVPIGPEEVAHASHDPISVIGDPCGSMVVLVVSSATMSSIFAPKVMGADSFSGPRVQTQSSTKPVKPVGAVQAPSESPQVAKEDGEDDFVGSEGLDITNYDFESEGVNLPGPTIRELVGDLDKSWGNSKEWMLQLRDGRQLVIPLSLYQSPDCMSVCSSLEGECVPGNVSITNVGQMRMWG